MKLSDLEERALFIFFLPVPCRYFSVVGGGSDLGWEELESQRGQYVLAHNGWVMNADPLVNFAAEGTTVSCR